MSPAKMTGLCAKTNVIILRAIFIRVAVDNCNDNEINCNPNAKRSSSEKLPNGYKGHFAELQTLKAPKFHGFSYFLNMHLNYITSRAQDT